MAAFTLPPVAVRQRMLAAWSLKPISFSCCSWTAKRASGDTVRCYGVNGARTVRKGLTCGCRGGSRTSCCTVGVEHGEHVGHVGSSSSRAITTEHLLSHLHGLGHLVGIEVGHAKGVGLWRLASSWSGTKHGGVAKHACERVSTPCSVGVWSCSCRRRSCPRIR